MQYELESLEKRLVWAREKAKLTQPKLAKLCGWDSQSRISHYERGRRAPVPDDLVKIAAALTSHGVKVSASWLQYGDAAPPAEPSAEGVTMTSLEQQLLQMFRALTPDEKGKVAGELTARYYAQHIGEPNNPIAGTGAVLISEAKKREPTTKRPTAQVARSGIDAGKAIK